MTRFVLTLSISVFVLLAGCAGNPAPSSASGADRDAQGCIPSAGYRWCDRTKQCERPWELAKQNGFTNTQQDFDLFCKASAATSR